MQEGEDCLEAWNNRGCQADWGRQEPVLESKALTNVQNNQNAFLNVCPKSNRHYLHDTYCVNLMPTGQCPNREALRSLALTYNSVYIL